jgi:hypothetical protein
MKLDQKQENGSPAICKRPLFILQKLKKHIIPDS